MKVSTIFEESSNGDMALKFNVDGVEKTIYTFSPSDFMVTLHERTEEHQNNFDGFKEGIGIVQDWVKKIWAKYRFQLKENTNMHQIRLGKGHSKIIKREINEILDKNKIAEFHRLHEDVKDISSVYR